MKIYNYSDTGISIYTHVTSSEFVNLPTDIAYNVITHNGNTFIPNSTPRNCEVHIMQNGSDYVYKVIDYGLPNIFTSLSVLILVMGFTFFIKLIQKLKQT